MPEPSATSRAPMHERLARPSLALLGGVLVALSLPPWGFWPLAFVGIIAFDMTMGDDDSRRTKARRGWLFGAGWLFVGMGWMVQLTGPGYVAAAAIFASLHALAAAWSPTGRCGLLGRPAAHTLVEALRFSFPFGGVPLATMGMSQVGSPLVGVVRVGGVILLTFVVFQLSFAASDAIRNRRDPDQRPQFAAFGVCVLVVVTSVLAPIGEATGETLRVAAVQGGGEQGTSALDVPSITVTERHLAATASIEPDPELGLVFWPENTIDVDDFATSELVGRITAEADRLGVPIAVGLTEDVILDGRRRFTNAHLVVTPDGELFSRYDKVRRVPFGEYVPLRGAIEMLSSAVDRVGDAVAGETPAVLDLPSGERLATVISWEVFFGGRAREGVKLDADLIVNPTNGASYTGTIVQTQQVASSRLRAIETGRWVVQAAPTGFTAFVDADGTVLERTAQREQRVLIADVELRAGRTWYVSIGDGPIIALLLAAFVVSSLAARRRSASRAEDGELEVSGLDDERDGAVVHE